MSPEETNQQIVKLLIEQSNRESERSERDEKRRRAEQRWNNTKIFLICLLFVVPVLSYSVLTAKWIEQRKQEHVAVVEIHGPIQASKDTTRIIQAMEKGMENSRSRGLILDIDTPGGSPAQSERMRLKMEELAVKYPDKPISCVGGDLIASAGYLIASGCKKLTVLPTTLTGSIGVIHQSFGLKSVAEKLNVEVRTITAGKNKAFLNEFSSMNEEHHAFVAGLTEKLHGIFIDYVRKGRGDRLKETPETFTGYIWVSKEALAMGLVDQIGTLDQVVKEDFGGAEIRYYGKQSPFEALTDLSASVQTVLGAAQAQLEGGMQLR